MPYIWEFASGSLEGRVLTTFDMPIDTCRQVWSAVLIFLGWRWAEGTENLVDDSHRLFVFYPGIQDDAMPMRRNGAALSDFQVCHLGEGRFLTKACD